MMTKQIHFLASIALTLGLLLIASPVYSSPFQDTIPARAIGVSPVQPQPVQHVNPTPQPGPNFNPPEAAIGVAPAVVEPSPVPQPQQVRPAVVPDSYNPSQPVPVNPAPVQEYYPTPQPAVVPQVIPHRPSPGAVYPGGQQPAKAVVAPGNFNEQRVLAGLQVFMNQQAALGQFPHNNKVLADLSVFIGKHSQPAPSKVSVVNSGPGTLRVTHANGMTTDVRPNFSLEIDVNSGRVHLSSQFQNALITLANISGAPAKFWDQDDRRHTALGTDRFGVNQQHHFTLIPGVWGYHLTQ